MDENKTARQRLILIIIGFIALVVIISLVAITFNKGPAIPTEKTSLPAINRETETRLVVYNMGDFTQVPITPQQSASIERSLKKFVAEYTTEKLKYISINSGSITTKYNAQSSSNEITFTITSNTGSVFFVSGLYVTTNDMYISIDDASSKDVYEDDYDEDHDH